MDCSPGNFGKWFASPCKKKKRIFLETPKGMMEKLPTKQVSPPTFYQLEEFDLPKRRRRQMPPAYRNAYPTTMISSSVEPLNNTTKKIVDRLVERKKLLIALQKSKTPKVISILSKFNI